MAALPDWGKRFLDQRRHATVATIEPDGSPPVVPVWYVFRNGMLCVGTQSSSRKAKNALAAVDDVVIAIRPATWRAWASAEMDQQFFGDLLSANRDKWFRTLD
jgi:pyridoxamine 5'-phosphate oxidase-like protein